MSDTFVNLYSNNFFESVPQLYVIGGGKMAEVLVNGFINADFFLKKNVFVCAKTQNTVDKWNKNGYTAYKSVEFYSRVQPNGIILLCVKPQIFLLEVCKDIFYWIDTNGLSSCVISAMAGITLKTIKNYLNSSNNIRIMPNIACETGDGTILISNNINYAKIEFLKLTTFMCSKLGYCLEIDESTFDVATAISGSGPAFIYLIMEALADGGVLCGLNRDVALKLITNTFKGTAELVLKTEKSIESLRTSVCSPGGTTIAGIRELEKAGVRSALIETIVATKKRAEELSLTDKI